MPPIIPEANYTPQTTIGNSIFLKKFSLSHSLLPSLLSYLLLHPPIFKHMPFKYVPVYICFSLFGKNESFIVDSFLKALLSVSVIYKGKGAYKRIKWKKKQVKGEKESTFSCFPVCWLIQSILHSYIYLYIHFCLFLLKRDGVFTN